MKSLITVMAHKEAQETFNRHFPIWKSLGADIMVAFPSDSRVLLPERSGAMGLEVGKAAHTGVQSIVRFRTILEHLGGHGYDRYAFFEYDSFAFEWPEMTWPVAAPVFGDNSPDRGFEGSMFLHPPIFFTREGISKTVEAIKKLPLTAENSVWDRWIGLALERAGVRVENLLLLGEAFSDNTIHEPRFPELFKTTRNRCFCFHGVKTKVCLDVILEARKIREAAKLVGKWGGTIEWKD